VYVVRKTRFDVCITFDLDFQDYSSGRQLIQEFESVSPILSAFDHRPDWRATWFVRLDSHMEKLFGRPDHIFHRYKRELEHLKQIGHEIGWHPHCFSELNDKWVQNTNVQLILEELDRYLPLIRDYGLNVVRMGWGFQANEIMHFLTEAGFVVDSSAIPRPHYQWEETVRDWTNTPIQPYRPSTADYRIPGEPTLPILEVPISVMTIPAPYDNGPVLRYCNLAYYPNLLRAPLQSWIHAHTHLVTITHPYELMPRDSVHPLFVFSVQALKDNCRQVEEFVYSAGMELSYIRISDFTKMPGLT